MACANEEAMDAAGYKFSVCAELVHYKFINSVNVCSIMPIAYHLEGFQRVSVDRWPQATMKYAYDSRHTTAHFADEFTKAIS